MQCLLNIRNQTNTVEHVCLCSQRADIRSRPRIFSFSPIKYYKISSLLFTIILVVKKICNWKYFEIIQELISSI
jgi:hypothetical protein